MTDDKAMPEIEDVYREWCLLEPIDDGTELTQSAADLLQLATMAFNAGRGQSATPDVEREAEKRLMGILQKQEDYEMNRTDILELALRAGFQLNTAYGQEPTLLMPVSDSATLIKFAELLLAGASRPVKRLTDIQLHNCINEGVKQYKKSGHPDDDPYMFIARAVRDACEGGTE